MNDKNAKIILDSLLQIIGIVASNQATTTKLISEHLTSLTAFELKELKAQSAQEHAKVQTLLRNLAEQIAQL